MTIKNNKRYVLGGIILVLLTMVVTAQIVNKGSLQPYSDTVLVYGEDAQVTDLVALTSLFDSLKAMTVKNVEEQISGEAKPVELSSQPLVLGDLMNNTKTTFTEDQLPTILSDGIVSDEEGRDYNYNLKVSVPNSKVIYGETSDNLDSPVIYADFNSNVKYDLRIVFPTAINVTRLTDSEITLFGKNFLFSSNAADLETKEITLFENSNVLKIYDQEPTVSNGHNYDIAILDETRVRLYVDGESRTVREGYSVKINNTSYYVKTIFDPEHLSEGQKRYVEISSNANSLVLKDGDEVEINGDSIQGTRVTITNSSEKVSEIKITVTPSQLDNEVEYIKMGDSFTDPIFKTVTFKLQELKPLIDTQNSTRDNVELSTSDERVKLKFTNRLGNKYKLDVLMPSSAMLDSNYVNTTNSSLWVYNATKLGTEDRDLVVQTNTAIKEEDYFVTTSGEYSQIWEVLDIRNDGRVTFRELSEDSSIDLTIAINSTGSLSLSDGSSATVKLISSDTIVLLDKASNFVYIKDGAKLILPTDNSGKIELVEETQYNGGVFNSNDGSVLGKTLTFTYVFKNGRSGNDMFLAATNFGTKDIDFWRGDIEDGDDVNSLTKYGTFIKQTGDEDKRIQIYYSDEAASAKFYIGGANLSVTTTTVQTSDIKMVKDSEAASYQNRNMIVVGGSCVNEMAAYFLETDYPTCGEEFTTLTGVLPGKYLIQVFENPWNSDKIVVLIAGYNAEDTTRAVNEILSNLMDLSVGSKIIG